MLTVHSKPRRVRVKPSSLSTRIDAHVNDQGQTYVRERGYAAFVEMGRRDLFRMFAQGLLRAELLAEIDELSRSRRPCSDDGRLTERFYELARGEKDVAARRAEYITGALLVAGMISDVVGFA